MLLFRDRGKWLVVTSTRRFTLQVMGRGPWLVVVIACKTRYTLVSGPDHCIRTAYVDHPDALCKSSGWYAYKCCLIFLEVVLDHPDVLCKSSWWCAYKCRLIFLEVVRKSVPCVLYEKVRMKMTRMTMRATCHSKMRATRLGGRGPYNNLTLQLCSF